MKICYFDAFSGISGDMTVGALIDAGADVAALTEGLESLGTGAEISVEKVKRRGIAASKFHVRGGETKAHRHLPQILRMIAGSALPERAKQNAAKVFEKLAEAEAKVHGVGMEKVHFHEVGAVDSICDIAGACLGLELLGVDAVYASAINTGSGTVNTEHGVLPVPAPATAELLNGKPVYARGPEMELTTPTGAAILAALARGFGAMPPMKLSASGYGAGDMDFATHANVLRVLLGEATGAVELVLAECYVRRDRVALIGFRGKAAELLLPPTTSLVRARRSLAGLPGGGGTPLAAGIEAGFLLADTLRRRGQTPILLLLSDGRANVARDGTPGRARAEADALAAAAAIRAAGMACLVIDISPRATPQARAIAAAMGATYLPLPYADAARLSRAVQAVGHG